MQVDWARVVWLLFPYPGAEEDWGALMPLEGPQDHHGGREARELPDHLPYLIEVGRGERGGGGVQRPLISQAGQRPRRPHQ